MRKISLVTLVFFLLSIFSSLGNSIHLDRKYAYASEEVVQTLHFEDTFEPTASLYGAEKLKKAARVARWNQVFKAKNDMFVFRFPKTFLAKSETDVRVILHINGRDLTLPLELELEWDGRWEDFYYTAPIFLDPTNTVSYSVETKPEMHIPVLSIIALNTTESSLSLAFDPETVSAVDASGVKIIKRSEWGADETLRYKDSPTWERIFERQKATGGWPKSDATLKYEAKISDIRTHLREKFSEQDTPVETITEDNSHPLVWPIEKTKTVEKIVIHHTAEDNRTEKDDFSIIRGDYYYHAIVRGWGDLGYNYMVGQRGAIYEGRAGGDYAVAAHALWNNKSTVGISVMGNFMNDSIVAEQEYGIKTIVTALSNKYGIDLHKTSIGHKECLKNNCLIQDFDTSNLITHRDVGYTSCPGNNLYNLIQTFRSGDTGSQGLTYRENPNIRSIKVASLTDTPAFSASSLNKWTTIKIRLSFSGSTIRLKSADAMFPRLVIGTASGTLRRNVELPFEAYGTNKIALVLGQKKYPFSRVEFAANLVTVTNWNRRPSWDSSGVYNDNTFRGKIILLNENWTLVAVNELPIEDYLKGLAEVSNNDNIEKIKTILVAARSYAYFYSDPAHRKFPGKAYDGSDNPDEFQKYLGYGYEKRSPNAGQLVDATNGKIVTYNGVSVKPWYFNESDGRTRSAKEYCQNRGGTNCPEIPYLQSVSDPGWVGHTLKWHGVGISGIGATYLATTLNFTYDQIIKYYLNGTEVEKKW